MLNESGADADLDEKRLRAKAITLLIFGLGGRRSDLASWTFGETGACGQWAQTRFPTGLSWDSSQSVFIRVWDGKTDGSCRFSAWQELRRARAACLKAIAERAFCDVFTAFFEYVRRTAARGAASSFARRAAPAFCRARRLGERACPLMPSATSCATRCEPEFRSFLPHDSRGVVEAISDVRRVGRRHFGLRGPRRHDNAEEFHVAGAAASCGGCAGGRGGDGRAELYLERRWSCCE